ncbi:unnamed protein product [Ixodes persulcatus]
MSAGPNRAEYIVVELPTRSSSTAQTTAQTPPPAQKSSSTVIVPPGSQVSFDDVSKLALPAHEGRQSATVVISGQSTADGFPPQEQQAQVIYVLKAEEDAPQYVRNAGGATSARALETDEEICPDCLDVLISQQGRSAVRSDSNRRLYDASVCAECGKRM